MRGRLSSLVIAFRSAPGGWTPLIIPAVLAGWVVAVVLLPGPQNPTVQWLSLVAAAAGLVVFAGHFVDVLSLRHRYPPLLIVGGAACTLLSGFCLWREPSGVLVVRLGLPLLLTGLLLFYTFYFSVFHGSERASKLRVGDPFPDFALPDSEGRLVTRASVVAGGAGPLALLQGRLVTVLRRAARGAARALRGVPESRGRGLRR
jgi:hypothetical protein